MNTAKPQNASKRKTWWSPWWACLFFVLCVIFSERAAHGQKDHTRPYCEGNLLKVDEHFPSQELGECLFYWLENPGEAKTREEVLSYSPEWTRNGLRTYSHGVTQSGVWFQQKIYNKDNVKREFLLEIGTASTDHVELWVLNGPSQEEVREGALSGDVSPTTGKFRKSVRKPMYDLEIEPGEQISLLIRVQTISSLTVPIHIWRHEDFDAHEQLDLLGLGVYLGIASAMIFFNFFTFFYMKKWEIIHFIMYLFFLMLYVVSVEGLGRRFVWSTEGFLQRHMSMFSIMCVTFQSILFTWSYLNGRTFPKFLKAGFFVSGVLNFIGAVFSTLSHTVSVWSQFFYTFAPVSLFALLISAVWLRRKDPNPHLRLFIWGWSFFLLGGLLESMRLMGFLPQSIWTQWVWKIGNSCESILMSLGIVEKFKSIQRENERLKNDLEKDKFQKQYELRMGKLEELGRMAVVLGDRINSPLNTIVLCVEEGREEVERGNLEALLSMVEKSALRIRQELQGLSPFKEFAPKDALTSPLHELEWDSQKQKGKGPLKGLEKA